ncbi:hypothetical protein Sango_2793600 [Sesamum angolense]|uniref:DUF8040 domain-containing protein n=1 Tax=Sesamum angolense TaxID=2727404 RepID=A0AAE1T8P6_9LAMI|nr:hypothetical protein Sango_2793600 [Sesamum angolense]
MLIPSRSIVREIGHVYIPLLGQINGVFQGSGLFTFISCGPVLSAEAGTIPDNSSIIISVWLGGLVLRQTIPNFLPPVDSSKLSRECFGGSCWCVHYMSRIPDQVRNLHSTKHVTVAEQVAMFLSVIAHHKKNCVVKHDFLNGRTVSKHFHKVLNTVYNMSHVFLAKPAPITDDCCDPRWRWFKIKVTPLQKQMSNAFPASTPVMHGQLERSAGIVHVILWKTNTYMANQSQADDEGCSRQTGRRGNKDRNGYLSQLEAHMHRAFPHSNIKAEPHITSKLHVWKKQYSTLVTMMGCRSGLGWDDSRCISGCCEKPAILRAHRRSARETSDMEPSQKNHAANYLRSPNRKKLAICCGRKARLLRIVIQATWILLQFGNGRYLMTPLKLVVPATAYRWWFGKI